MSNWKNWFRGSARSREIKDMTTLYEQVVDAQACAPFSDEDKIGDFILEIIFEVCERRGVTPSTPLGNALYDTVRSLLSFDGLIIELPPRSTIPKLTIEEGIQLRAIWKRHLHYLHDHERLTVIWRDKLVWLFSGMLEYFPLSAFTDIGANGVASDNAVTLPEAHIGDLCDNLPEVLDRLILTFYDADVVNAHLFDPLRERLEGNVGLMSGVPPGGRHGTAQKIIMPGDNKSTAPEYLIDGYLQGTPLRSFFYYTLPFAIPFPARFEHTHIVAGSGHGKTQLLQFLIHHDLVKAQEDGRSIIVMDSQGDMIRTIAHLKLFDPSEGNSLADRFVLIDPTDVEHPVGLNMFDFDRARMGTLSAQDREMILNATVETYEYFFGALLGAELTQRQGVIFRYLARLMMEIPNATIHTLLELMMNGEKYRPYMEKLTGTAHTFFATQFFDRQFAENKKQITARLWGVLSNTTLERMLSHPKNKVDLFKLTQEGKIILVNTAKDFLGHEGSSIFGRFIVSLIAQAAIQRAILPAHERTPTFAYIDEAEDYFDENIDRMVNQTRKYKIGLVFSHQNLDQLSPALRASVLASTSIKFAGGVSSKDANSLDAEFRTDANFLLQQKKYGNHTEFACYVKNFTARALSVSIPLGVVEREPVLDDIQYAELIERNRVVYGVEARIPQIEIVPPVARRIEKKEMVAPKGIAPAPQGEPVHEDLGAGSSPYPELPAPRVFRTTTPSPKYEVKEQGGGGKQHKYLAQLVKQLAEERAFKASIEEPILDGAGRVDVHLSQGERKIAVEISVTTGRDWELQNVEKCLSAGYEEVLVVSTNARHLKSLARFIPANLDEAVRDKVRYFSPEDLIEHLDQVVSTTPTTTESTVRGYKVKVTSQALSPSDIAERRSAVAQVIARSLSKAEKQ
ncbi:MAG: hypothetical protein M0P64_02965 [Candidatus Pacebacteria bacterium]|jgi:hypothetical protein|nr:hypothetical protein [Candidatus Paceibacterota bacterium]